MLTPRTRGFKPLRFLYFLSILLNVLFLYLYWSDEVVRVRSRSDVTSLPTIYAITPTYARLVQKADLTRLCHTFRLVPKLHWILVEDSAEPTPLVTRLLDYCSVPSTQLFVPTPLDFKTNASNPRSKPRGVLQRNAGLEWVRENARVEGVFYFADDDNTYDLRLFDEMRWTHRVSVWPVGLVGGLRYERPVCRDDHVIGWFTAWGHNRPFATDMAGFAVHVSLCRQKPSAQFRLLNVGGYLETDFLKQITTLKDLEPKADNCSKVLVWHTRTETPSLQQEKNLQRSGLPGSDLAVEL